MVSPLFPLTVAFCAGILLSRWVHTSIPLLFLVVATCLTTAWLAHYRRQARLASLLSLATFLSLGLLVPPIHQASYPPQHLKTLTSTGKLDLNEPCRITGICSKGSISRGIGEQIELSVQKIENRFSTFSAQGKVRLALYYQKGEGPRQQPLLRPGDRIEVLANLRFPKNFNNPGQFDYVAYLERQDVALVGTIKNTLLITRLSANEGSLWSRQIQRLRHQLQAALEASFAESEAVLPAMKALLLGDKQALSPQVEEQFRATGLYHVLVVSGQHVAVMAMFLFGFFRLIRLPRAFAIVCTMTGLVVYSAVTKAQSSIVRATVMASVFLLVLQFDRDRNLLNSLSLAAGCLLWFDPFWLFDAGFQLSFLAVLAIALIALPLLAAITQPWREALHQLHDPGLDSRCAPRLADLRIWLRLKIEAVQSFFRNDRWNLTGRCAIFPLRAILYLAELLIVSTSIQVLFAVLMVIYFHRVSPISPISNLLAVPLVGCLVPVGFLLLLCSFIGLPPLEWLLARTCSALTEGLLSLAEVCSGPGWGNFRLPTPPLWLSVLYFLFLTLALAPLSKRVRRVSVGLATGALVLLLTFPFTPRTPRGLLQLTFLDVRQGDSIFVSFPDQANLIIDGGGLLGQSFGEHFEEERFDVGEQVVSPFLWSRGVRKLDVVMLTHAHHDHMSGLGAILNNFEVGELWVGQNPPAKEYLNLLKTSLRKSVPIRSFAAGDSISFHSGKLEFLNPIKGAGMDRVPTNNDSLAFRLRLKDRKFLLTGDVERRVEEQMLAEEVALQSDLLKVAHHGSRSSTLPEFLNRINPLWAVISVAEHSPFGHPHPEVVERLKRRGIAVFRTDRHGAVTVTTDGRRLEVESYLENETEQQQP
jgi:competence protein ComEC